MCIPPVSRMKGLLQKYQKIHSKDPQETTTSTPTPVPNQTTSYYSTYERIRNESIDSNIATPLSEIPLPPSFESLGLLFIIIDDLPHELIWRAWLMTSKSSASIKIFIHAKFPEKIRSPWVKSHLVNFHYFPEWGSIEITKVMVHLLREVCLHSSLFLTPILRLLHHLIQSHISLLCQSLVSLLSH